MKIVFDNCKDFDKIKETFLVLQLETFKIEGNDRTAFCIVDAETIPPEEIPDLQRLTDLHVAIIEAWNKEDYATVVFGLPHLVGKFGGELDTFYNTLKSRIKTA